MNVPGCLLVESHALLRDGLSLLISQAWPDMPVQGAASFAQAIEVLSGSPCMPLVLLSLSLPDAQGIDALRRVRALAPAVHVIVISGDGDARTVVEVAEAGAIGYIPRVAGWRVLRSAMAEALSALAAPAIRHTGQVPGPHAREALGLTPRQMTVLRLLAEGKSNKAIGRELGMALSTVKTHLEAIFARLAVNTRTQAVVEAARLGLTLGAQAGAD